MLLRRLHRRQRELGEPAADRQLHPGGGEGAPAGVRHEHPPHRAVADDDAARRELDEHAIGGAAEEEGDGDQQRGREHGAEHDELLPAQRDADDEHERRDAGDDEAGRRDNGEDGADRAAHDAAGGGERRGDDAGGTPCPVPERGEAEPKGSRGGRASRSLSERSESKGSRIGLRFDSSLRSSLSDRGGGRIRHAPPHAARYVGGSISTRTRATTSWAVVPANSASGSITRRWASTCGASSRTSSGVA